MVPGDYLVAQKQWMIRPDDCCRGIPSLGDLEAWV